MLCLYEGEVQPNEAPLSPPTASPTVTLGRWCWQWLVTVSCTPLSSLHPSHPLLLCSTFIWPHLLPLAFNAELGSPLIKVKASQCLAETERKWETERGRETEREKVREGLKESDERMRSFFTVVRLIYCGIQMSWSIILHVWPEPLVSLLLLQCANRIHMVWWGISSSNVLVYILKELSSDLHMHIHKVGRLIKIIKNGQNKCRYKLTFSPLDG